MKYYALPVINRTVETEVVSEETLQEIQQGGLTGMLLAVIGISLLILLGLCVVLFLWKRGIKKKNKAIENVKKPEKSAGERVKIVKQDIKAWEYEHSSHTKRLWQDESVIECEMTYLFVKDMEKPDRVYKIELDKPVIVGRTKGDILLKSDSFVSSEHCVISYENGILFVEDLNSSNGTYYKGIKIKDKAAVINEGIIKVGNTQLKLIVKKV